MRIHKIIGILIIVGSLGMIGYQATKNESSVTFFTPAEVFASPHKFENKIFRVSGLVLEGTKHWDPNTQILTFEMSDLNNHNFFVSYKGLPPDLFKERQGVIVEGRLEKSAPHTTQATDFATAIHLSALDSPLYLSANLLMVKHSEVYDTQEDHSKMREVKLSESLFNNIQKQEN